MQGLSTIFLTNSKKKSINGTYATDAEHSGLFAWLVVYFNFFHPGFNRRWTV
jgi:hypothetical protein